MAHETEIKLHVADKKELERALKKVKAKPIAGAWARVHEWNVIYDTPQGGLAKHGQLLRIRTETPQKAKGAAKDAKRRVVVTFKQPAVRIGHEDGGGEKYVPAGRHKIREEIESQGGDAETLGKIFEGLGMRGWFRYEKYRTTMKLPAKEKWAKDLLIELDETPVGDYVELEGPPDAIDRAAEALGYRRSDYIVKSYLALYLEACRARGETPCDMVFKRK